MDSLVTGIIPVVQTPFDDGEIATDALEKHIEFLIQHKVGGLWVLGTGSEDMHLTYAQRLQVAVTATRVNRGRLPLFLGAGFYSLYETESFIDDTKGLQFDAYHIMPYHPLLSQSQLAWMYTTLAESSPKPLWLYSSANWSNPLESELVKELREHHNITGIKFSDQKTGNVQKMLRLERKDFQVITAVASQFLVCLVMGAAASTTSMAGVIPELFNTVYHEFTQGRIGAAQESQERINEFLSYLPKSIKRDNFLGAAEEKYMLNLRIDYPIEVAEPHREVVTEEQDEIINAIGKSGLSGFFAYIP